MPIESITEGAVVESVDPATGEPTPAVVTATPARLFEGTIYDITVDPGEPGGGDETTISATGEHPFLVARAGARASALESRADPDAVALVEPLDTVDGRWVPARDLAEGDTVRTMSADAVAGTATVAKVRARHAVAPVYNLTVEGTSRYLVGACGVVVHNTGCGMGGAIQPFYPPNSGFAGAPTRVHLLPGTVIDRFGGTGFSRFFAPPGTPASMRSLPPGSQQAGKRVFEVVKPLEVEVGTAQPWFGQPGGGIQYRTPVDLDVLLHRGILREISSCGR